METEEYEEARDKLTFRDEESEEDSEEEDSEEDEEEDLSEESE